MGGEIGPLAVTAIVGGTLGLAVANWWRKKQIRERTQVVWPGGHVVSPVRRLGVGYGRNDPGSYEWRWRCRYCTSEHRRQDQLPDVCIRDEGVGDDPTDFDFDFDGDANRDGEGL